MKITMKTLPVKGSTGTRTEVCFHGRIGDVVYYVRNGRQYMRRYAEPRVGVTERQELHRHVFAAAVENARIVYDNAPLCQPFRRAWAEQGYDRSMSLFNYLVRYFMQRYK